MQHNHLSRLSKPVREFVLNVEEHSGLKINVILDPDLNTKGPSGEGELAAVIDAQRIKLFTPTNGYFPDGAVRHEVLHVQRFLVEGVPKLALADAEAWDEGFARALGNLDNAIEHLNIVPKELGFHPERLAHWQAVMLKVCLALPTVPNEERALSVCLHWAFLRHVLPHSVPLERTKRFALEHGLLDKADGFSDQIQAADTKEHVVSLLFACFPEIPKQRAALEYISSIYGTRQRPIP